MMIYKTALAALALSASVLLSAPAAQAADPIDPVYDWSGGYLGLQAGYGWGDSVHIDIIDRTSGHFDIEGFAGGITAGWNYQTDDLVFGLESDLSISGIDGASEAPEIGYTTGINWFGTSRLRAGFAIDNFLLFASGGVAYGEIEADAPFANARRTETNFGWTLGAGAEWAASENMTLKIEYLFVDLGDIAVASPVPLTAYADENHIVRAGLNWHF